MIIAGLLTLVLAAAAGLWLRGGVFAGGEAQLVRRALAAGRLDEASQALERWLRSSPDSAEAHYSKARIAWIQNDFPTVDRELARAQMLGYARQPVARLRGLLLARGNRSSEAEPLLRQALDGSRTLDPEVADALVRLYLGTFRLFEAAAVLDRWMREAPDDARPYLLQTEIDTRHGLNPELIIARYRAALERDPSLDRARLGLAHQLRRTFHHAEAASEYAAYVSRQPGDPLGYVGAGQNALEMGDEAEATRLLDRAVSLAPHDPAVLGGRATLELHQGHPEAALRYLDEALKFDRFDYRNRYQHMLILARLGRKGEAIAERAAVERFADERRHFGQLSLDLMHDPLNPQLRIEAARWLMAHGHEDEAVEWANLVLRSDPSHPAMNRLLADYYRNKGQLGLANLHEAHAARPSDHTTSPPQ